MDIDISSRLELFVDDYLIDRLDGVELRMHQPYPQGVALRLDDGVVEAENKKGVCHFVAVEDVFAASIKSEGDGKASRKAGFRG